MYEVLIIWKDGTTGTGRWSETSYQLWLKQQKEVNSLAFSQEIISTHVHISKLGVTYIVVEEPTPRDDTD